MADRAGDGGVRGRGRQSWELVPSQPLSSLPPTKAAWSAQKVDETIVG